MWAGVVGTLGACLISWPGLWLILRSANRIQDRPLTVSPPFVLASVPDVTFDSRGLV